MTNKKIYIIVLFIVNLILFNIFSESSFFRLDFTQDKRYTVSEASKQILSEIQQPITITGYFSENLPVQFHKSIQDFKDLVTEYHAIANGKIAFRFTSPQEDDPDFQQAQQNGLQPVSINVQEKDQVKQQLAYMGVVIQQGAKKELIPFIQPNVDMEYPLSAAIKKVSITNKKTIGFLQGHGEAEVDNFKQAMPDLNVLYTIVPVALNDTVPVLQSYQTVVVAAPKQNLEKWETDQLRTFMHDGGNLVLALNSVSSDMQTLMANNQQTEIEQWLAGYGINVEQKLMVDQQCAVISVAQKQGNFQFRSQMRYPFIPVFSAFSDHPVTKGIESVQMQYVSPLKYSGDSTLKFTPLVVSSEKTDVLNVPTTINPHYEWQNISFNKPHQVAAAVIEGKFEPDGKSGKIILFGDGDFAASSPENAQQSGDNVALFVNSIDWLADASGLMQLRSKQISSRPIENLEEDTKSLLKYLNFFAPILLLIAYGIFTWQRNRNIRKKRMEEDYV